MVLTLCNLLKPKLKEEKDHVFSILVHGTCDEDWAALSGTKTEIKASYVWCSHSAEVIRKLDAHDWGALLGVDFC